LEPLTLRAIECERVRRRLVLGALFAVLAACRANSSARDGGENGSPDSTTNDFVRAGVGFSFERVCTAEADGARLAVTAVSCTILSPERRLRANLATESGNPLLAVTYDGLEPGEQSTAGAALTDVLLLGVCPASAKGSPEPCNVELVESKRAAQPATGGAVETGSSVTLRVACPSSLAYDGGDNPGMTEQSPTRFEIQAENCTAF
jgi:hypothetical protein